ncbi:MAG: phosphatidate cytidylyltransferase [Holosporaceae bacterium]|jgi:phosphatidate cytidylyltransferase|nr:phosphatidate cytidylyltransferase [Holosporaceae bacterium]
MDGNNGVVGVMVKEKENISNCGPKKELVQRLLSSILFIPVIAIVCFVPYGVLCCLSLAALGAIIREIFSTKISERYGIRIVATVVCLGGMCGFIYCRKVLGTGACIFLICASSFTDIGAYCFGKAIGGPKLCPTVSPNKTWAGLWGGIIVGNIACYSLRNLFFSLSGTSKEFVSLYTLVLVQCVIISSVVGDLLESFFKRKISVKDMGSTFPGHGGFLDRLDSLIVASIALALKMALF